MSKYLIAILLSAWSISLRAQVAEKLQQLGMENIQTVTEVNGNTTIAFEDNVYRGTYRGIRQSHRSSHGRNVRGKSANGGVGAQYPPAMHYAER